MIASEPIRVRAADGYLLAATVFRPPATTPVRQAILIGSAMGVKRGYYFAFAEYLAERGRAVVTFDYRGIGNSRPRRLRGFEATLSDWGKLDLAALIDWVRESFPDTRLSMVAHSVGGQIFGLASNNGSVRDLLAVGAQSGYWGHWAGRHRLRVLSLWYLFIPVLSRVIGYFPSRLVGLGECLPARVAREWAYWGRHPEYVVGRIDAEARRGYHCFRGRLRALSASDDVIAPPPAVAGLLELYPAAQREYRHVTPAELGLEAIGHFGYFRERVGERLWPPEAEWLSA